MPSQEGKMMENLTRDIKHSSRSLLRVRGFATTVILTLSVCLAVSLVIFAIVDSVLLRPLPVPDADAIVLMSNRYPKAGVGSLNTSSPGDYYDRLQKVNVFQEQAMFRFADQTLNISGMPERTPSMVATPSLFRLLQIRPVLGRAFFEAEGEVGGEQKVILSYGMWRQLYGSDDRVLGRELQLSGRAFTIVGVMPPGFVFLNPEVRLWVPLAFTPEEKTIHHSNNWYSIGRLKPGARIEQAQAQVDALNAANLDRFPQMKEALVNAGFHTAVEPIQDMLVKDVKSILYLLWAGSAFVLLIGVLNVVNLGLARLTLRRREVATRLALGATRVQLIRQFLVENLLLATASGVIGLVLCRASLRGLQMFGLSRFPRADEVTVDGQVVLVAMLMAIVVGALTGLLPFIGFLKVAFNSVLHEDDRAGTGSKGARRVRQGLVVTQIGFAFSLLLGAGLLLVSFRELLHVDPGFRTDGIVTASLSAAETKYPSSGQLQTLMNRSLDAIRQTPGVLSAGATTTIPFGGNYNDSVMLAEGYVMKPGESVISPLRIVATPGYLETMGISLVRGRYFRESDDQNSPLVVIVDERLAHKFWQNRDPVGERMYEPSVSNLTKTDDRTRWFRVIGVVRSVRLEDLSGKGNPEGAYYFPYFQDTSNTYTLAVRTVGDSAAMVAVIRAKMVSVDPELALFDVRTMSERTELSLSSRRTSMLLALAFGALALFLAAVGIYGVLAYLVTHRRREIGIRMALGSTQSGIVKLVLQEGFVLVGIGLVLGVAGAVALRTVVATEIYGIGSMDPLVIGSVAALLGVAALAACVLPARWAAQVDPVVVLSGQ
jgi:predicted permease